MRAFVLILLLAAGRCSAQADTAKWLRCFPITDYMVTLNDTTIVVQVEMPEDLKFQEKQLGLIYGTYRTSVDDAVHKGYGRIPRIAGHFIRLQDVYAKPYYDRYNIFLTWTETEEKTLVDSMA